MPFVAALLATWRLTHLLVAEDGPWDLVARLRRIAGSGWLGRLMDCLYCLSVWVALPFALWLADDWLTRLAVAWPALSGGAILLERLTSRAGDHDDPGG
ncbi:MAG: DUF1360 domain-containing protein [Gemmatimonadota bacterium]